MTEVFQVCCLSLIRLTIEFEVAVPGVSGNAQFPTYLAYLQPFRKAVLNRFTLPNFRG